VRDRPEIPGAVDGPDVQDLAAFGQCADADDAVRRGGLAGRVVVGPGRPLERIACDAERVGGGHAKLGAAAGTEQRHRAEVVDVETVARA